MYVIAGVTGRTGGAAAEQLLKAGKKIRVIVRDAARGESWRARGAEVAVANLEDAEALARALEGAAGAYLLYPASFTSADPIGDGWRTADAIARAISRSALPHLVFLSTQGATLSEGTGILRALHGAEVRLRDSRAAISFIRASYFLEEWLPALEATAGGDLPTFIRPDLVMPMVASRDIGALAARTLLEGAPAGGREVLRLSGPRDVSPDDLARDLSGLLGRPVTARFAPTEAVPAVLEGFGASPAMAREVAGLYRWINEGDLGAGSEEGRPVRGPTDPMTLFREALGRGV